MKKILPLLALLLVACLFDKEEKDPGTHSLMLKGKLAGLRKDTTNATYWFLNVDSLVPGYTPIWTDPVCHGTGYLGDSATAVYTNQWMQADYINLEFFFYVPQVDSALARGFTHYRLEIFCPDSVDLPPQSST